MRNLINKCAVIIIMMAISLTAGYSNNEPPNSTPAFSYLIKNQEVSFAVSSIEHENEFINTTFSTKHKTIFLETEKEISFIQVLNTKGELEYQLPISAKKLHINMNDFTTGFYVLNILLEGNDTYISTELEKAF